MSRKQDPSEIFSDRYVAQLRRHMKSRDRTVAAVSIMRARRAILRVVGLRGALSLRLRVNPMSGGRRQQVVRTSKKLICRMGTPVPGKAWLVTSPFAPDGGYVDVTGFPRGTAVEDPYTGKIFLTP